MNKVITINLNGNACQLEEGGYELLRAYLDGAARRLEGNPDRDEIIADIEQAIADKCRVVLGAYKNVVVTREIQQIIEEMGPVENAAAETDEGAASGKAAAPNQPGGARPGPGMPDPAGGTPIRRLYKIPEGAMIRGVCNGLAAYFNIDVTVVRIGFALTTCFWGTGILVYLALMVILPTADTSAEKAAAHGMPSTAQEFIRRAREGYYEGMKSFSDQHAHQEWRRRFRREMRGWRRTFRHEMRAGAHQWQQTWAQQWAPRFPPGPGGWMALPMVSLLRGGLALLLIFGLVSLLTTGAAYGLTLPAGLPVWAGILILVVAYNFIAWPLKALRRAYYYSAAYGSHGAPPFVWAFDVIVGLGFFAFFFWWASHHWPEIREAIAAFPPTVRQGADAVRDWWTHR